MNGNQDPVAHLALRLRERAGRGCEIPSRWPGILADLLDDDPGALADGLEALTEAGSRVQRETADRLASGRPAWHETTPSDDHLLTAVRDHRPAIQAALTVFLGRYAAHRPRACPHFYPLVIARKVAQDLHGVRRDQFTACVAADVAASCLAPWQALATAATACVAPLSQAVWPAPEAAREVAIRARVVCEPWRESVERCKAADATRAWARGSNDARWRVRRAATLIRSAEVVFGQLALDANAWHLTHGWVHELTVGIARMQHERSGADVLDLLRHDLAWLLERASSDGPGMLGDPPRRGGLAERQRLFRARQRCFSRWWLSTLHVPRASSLEATYTRLGERLDEDL